MKASEFDRKFDEGENVLTDLDVAQTRRPSQENKHGDKKRQRHVLKLFENAEKLAALEESPMSDAEVEPEIAAARKARR
jgi:hypothetical protein